MSRNHRYTSSPLSHRGRDQYDLRQAAADFLFGGFADHGDRYFSAPSGIISGRLGSSEYQDSRDFYSSGSFPHGDGGPEPQALKPTYRNSRSRPNMSGQAEERQPLGKAMKKLHKLLGDVEKAYREFQDHFDRDVENIKSYATDKSLGSLWEMKVAGKKGHTDGEDVSETPESFAKKHEGMEKKLALALSIAIRSKFGPVSRKAAIRIEDAHRLQEKVDTANTQIMDLLDKVPKDRDHCVSLLNELALLKSLVDPEADANKKLYRSGDGADDEASEAEGDEQEQGGGGNHWP
ncbi:hypothetical protein BKA65DRAFT_478120 [Rhexocercosporidium sp. MPI-PUGE-AT-0058]|nr:hypothetical protein BKA65DRAFT_478120 [Rhexocercosporidium sp. MPI-PUGE-AT-0058]